MLCILKVRCTWHSPLPSPQIPLRFLRQSSVHQILGDECAVIIGIPKACLHEVATHQCARRLTDPLRTVGIGPVARLLDQSAGDRVGMNVASLVEQVTVLVRRLYLVVAFEERAAVVVALVAGLAVTVEDPLGQQAGRMITILADQEVTVLGRRQ